MTRWLTSVVSLVATIVAAQGSMPAGLVKAHEAFIVAGDKGDRAAFQQLLTDDVVWIDRSGAYRDKNAQINQLQPSPGTRTADPRVYPAGAVIVGTRTGGGVDTRSLQLWVPQGGQWRLALLQTVQIGGQPPAPGTGSSGALPPSSGSPADIKAIDDAIATLSAGNRRGDAKNFAASVTDQFVAVGSTGVLSKQDRIKQLTSGAAQTGIPTVEQTSTRIYGDIAVTTSLMKNAAGREVRQSTLHVRQGGKWLRAGVITTDVAR
jgi:hypothetical protein